MKAKKSVDVVLGAPWVNGESSLTNGMKCRSVLLMLDGRERQQELTMVARKLSSRFASPKWKGGWMLANELHFVVVSGNQPRLEVQTDAPLSTEESGLLRGYALASLELLKDFVE